jgi:hypothetical protein
MLQYFGVDHSVIDAAAGTFETHVAIGYSYSYHFRGGSCGLQPPIIFWVLPWHFIEEFKMQARDYLATTGKFIMPLPHFELI